MPSFFIKTLGCKVNSYDSHALENRLRDLGWVAAESPESCDAWVLNTCTVTQAADRDVRNFIRNIRSKNPSVRIVVTGCFVQANPEDAAALEGVDLIVGNDRKSRVADLVVDLVTARSDGGSETLKSAFTPPAPPSEILFDRADSRQTRAVLKIQDGCDGECAYCIVPRARGQSRSVPTRVVLDEARRLLAEGCREIVLTGIHIGMYRSTTPGEPATLAEFLDALLALPEWNLHGARLRLSSVEPNEIDAPLLAVLAARAASVCDHFHLPLQSGSDAVLRRMNRTYTRDLYADRVAALRAIFPRANIGADVIVGFPGETETDFELTQELVRQLALSGLHVFPFSRRPGTPAATMTEQIPERVVKRRADALRDWSKDAHMEFARSFIGASLRVLWERTVDRQGRRVGHAANYLAVRCPDSEASPWNRFSSVLITHLQDDGTLTGIPRETP